MTVHIIHGKIYFVKRRWIDTALVNVAESSHTPPVWTAGVVLCNLISRMVCYGELPGKSPQDTV